MPGGHIANGDCRASRRSPASTTSTSPKASPRRSSTRGTILVGNDKSLHPYKGETTPKYTDFQDDGKYSWLKSPTFYGKPMQVGPLAHVLSTCSPPATSRPEVRDEGAGSRFHDRQDQGRHRRPAFDHRPPRGACRRSAVLMDELVNQWNLLLANMARAISRPSTSRFPEGRADGRRLPRSPRGVLSHWVVIQDGKIKNYQCVVPSTWNAAPRNEKDAPGAYEACLVGNPIADPEKPLEVLRTVHSFDPCIACAIHVMDEEHTEIVKVKLPDRRLIWRKDICRSGRETDPVSRPLFHRNSINRKPMKSLFWVSAIPCSRTRASACVLSKNCSSVTSCRPRSRSSTAALPGWNCLNRWRMSTS